MPEVSWVVSVPETVPGQARPASPDEARRLAGAFASADCAECSHFVERAMRAIALALDDLPDGEPPFEGPTD
jgi:hypothetical protein